MNARELNAAAERRRADPSRASGAFDGPSVVEVVERRRRRLARAGVVLFVAVVAVVFVALGIL